MVGELTYVIESDGKYFVGSIWDIGQDDNIVGAFREKDTSEAHALCAELNGKKIKEGD